MAAGMGVTVETILPDDPAELDELLEKGARLLLAARSDGAPAASVWTQPPGAGERAERMQ
jgi:hypothetical protein